LDRQEISPGTLKQIARLELTPGSDWPVLGRVRLRAVKGVSMGWSAALTRPGWQRRITGVGSPATLDRRERPWAGAGGLHRAVPGHPRNVEASTKTRSAAPGADCGGVVLQFGEPSALMTWVARPGRRAVSPEGAPCRCTRATACRAGRCFEGERVRMAKSGEARRTRRVDDRKEILLAGQPSLGCHVALHAWVYHYLCGL